MGASLPIALKEKKARVEDALHATRAAVEEGIVPGGGVVLIRAAKALNNLKLFETVRAGEVSGDEDEQAGVKIVQRALEEPLRQMVANAGKEGSVIVERVRSEANPRIGYNVLTEEFEDLVVAGVAVSYGFGFPCFGSAAPIISNDSFAASRTFSSLSFSNFAIAAA